MAKYGVRDVSQITFIAPKLNLLEKNVPNYIKVSEEEYHKFLKDNEPYIKSSRLNTATDSLALLDYYDNVVAGANFYIDKTYYINPELLKLGLQKKEHIENKYEKIGEEIVLQIDNPSSINLS